MVKDEIKQLPKGLSSGSAARQITQKPHAL